MNEIEAQLTYYFLTLLFLTANIIAVLTFTYYRGKGKGKK